MSNLEVINFHIVEIYRQSKFLAEGLLDQDVNIMPSV